ncbi:hypothetical protein O0L34_g11979 [Tuta absoluta]|nr:hypothetical protein O0L34_g11979 [Tuta absoluta]
MSAPQNTAAPVYKLEKDLCRCCHAEGSFFNFSDTVYNSGQVEVYSDMMQSTLGVNILPMDGDVNMMTFTICGQCVLRLRDAHNFKQQVIECEQRFKGMYSNMVLADRKTINIVQIKEEDDAAETFQEDIKIDVEANSGNDYHWKSDHSEEEPEVKIKFVSKSKRKPKSKRKQTPPKRISVQPLPETSRNSEDPENSDAEVPWWHRDAKPPKGSRQLRKRPIQDTDYRIQGDSYICCHCEYNTKDDKKYLMMKHIQSKHFKLKKYHCSHCNLAFRYEAPLTVHKLQAHNIDDKIKCNACDAAFNAKKSLKSHMQNFHKLGCRTFQKRPIQDTDYRIQGENYMCCHCDKIKKNEYLITRHIQQTHFNVRKRHCPYCNLVFRYETPLTVHKLQAHNIDERAKCNACDAAFNSKERLDYHMKSFHKLGKKFKCDSCEYDTYSKLNLDKHRISHTAERNFQCKHCRKSFKRKTNMILHEKIHTNDRTKVCKECNKTFVQKASLNYHMTKYHPEVKF